MSTFAENYCARTGCPPDKFHRRIFWRTLHWHALPFAPLLLLGDYFESDDSLINACGRASRMREIRDETRDFPFNPQNSSWLHRHANLRVSTRRLCSLASAFLSKAPSDDVPVTARQPFATSSPAPSARPTGGIPTY